MPRLTRPFTESLETRRLLTIAVAGTAAADMIRVAADGPNVLVVVNGSESRFAIDPTGIIVSAGDGADTIRLDDASNIPVTINGQAANDQVEVGGGNVRSAHLAEVSVVGGAGADSLTINDSLAATGNLDVSIDNPIDTYLAIAAAPGGVIRADESNGANAVETITFSGGSQGDFIYVHGTSALATLIVNGGIGNDSVVVGNDLDSQLKGPATLDGGPGADVLTIDDSADSFADTYFLGGTPSTGTVRKNSGGSTISLTGFGNVSLVAGAAGGVPNNQLFRVSAFPDAINTTILAGNGDDTLYFGDGATTLDTFKSNLTFDGGDGPLDTIVYNDTVGTDLASYAISPTSVTNTGTATLNFTHSEGLSLTANGAANDLRINATATDLFVTLNGGAGNDTIRVGNGDFDATILNGVSLVGGSGTDSLIFEDTADDPGNDSYTIATGLFANSGTMTKGSATAFWSTASSDRVESITLLASANSDTIRVNNINPAIKLSIDAGFGDDSLLIASTTEGTAAASTVTISSGEGSDSIDVNSDNSASDALVAFTSPVEEFRDLRIRAGGRASVASGANGILAVRGTLTLGGRLELANATMIASASSYAAIRDLVVNGYAGGAWDGGAAAAAIVSSTAAASPTNDALAVAVAGDLALPTFSGVATIANDVIVRYTLVGDANLDRVVGFEDLVLLAQSFNTTGKTWAQGDFDFDPATNVDFNDLVLLAQNYTRML